MSSPPVLIIGAGISGISSARNLKKEFIVLEKSGEIGGLSTQYYSGGYWFDYGGHYFHFQDKLSVKTYLEKVLPFREYRRKSKVFVLTRLIPFPIQFHLSFLPARRRREIVEEILRPSTRDSENLHEYLKDNFGSHFFELFFKPFLEKYYGCDLRDMAARMDKGSIPVPDKKTVIAGARGEKFLKAGYNPLFYYPRPGLRGFFQEYSRDVSSRISLQEEVLAIDVDKRIVETTTRTLPYQYLINTMPLKSLLKVIKPGRRFPDHRMLQHTSTLVCNVVLKRRRRRFHWVYLPEKKIPFYRVGFYPAQEAPVCYLERSLSSSQVRAKDDFYDDILFTLKELKLIDSRSEIVYYDARKIPISYVIFNHDWQKITPLLLEQLKLYNIYSIGRYGAWNYTSMSDDVLSALQTARIINGL